MDCPRCGARWKVTNVRQATSDESIKINRPLIQAAQSAVGWYTQDWVVREHVCSDPCCGHRGVTLQMLIGDILDMVEERVNERVNPRVADPEPD